MNDLYYIKYKASLMLIDMMSLPSEVELAHRRLCDFIWALDELPSNENEFLRSHCKVTQSDWGRVKQSLIKKGWFAAGEFFSHRGAVKSLNDAKEDYVANCNQTAKARKAPLLCCVPDPVTGIVKIQEIVTPAVTTPVTGSVTHPVTHPQSESESELQLKKNCTTSNYSSPGQPKPLASETKLTLPALERVARSIVSNKSQWSYDNCKIPADAFTAASLVTVLKPYVGVIESKILPAWNEAVTRAHQATVDGLAEKPASYCIACFKEQLGKLQK